jgi:hypothetical protein
MKSVTTFMAATCLASTLPARAESHEPVRLWRAVEVIVTVTGALKTLVEVYDAVARRWTKPEYKAGDLWLCKECKFPQAGTAPSTPEHAAGDDFIKATFPGRPWGIGQAIVLCDRFTCFIFKFDGSRFYAIDEAFKDPHVGYANGGSSLGQSARGGGEHAAPRSGLTAGWSPSGYLPRFEAPLKEGTVTIRGGSSGGGGGGGHNILWVESD